jgi:hypothetical protein
MKIVISGGLGNQMFQYALYLALKRQGRNVILDTSLFNYTKMHNGYELERCFGFNDLKVKVSRWGILKLRFFLKYNIGSVVYADKSHYDIKVFKTKSRYLNGCWQSEKYFSQIQDEIQEVFEFKNIDTENQKLAKEIQSTNSVSLHIRRGDYLGNSKYEGVCSEEYYLKAINRLNKEISSHNDAVFYVFSDDIEFVNQFTSKLNIKTKIIAHNKSEDSYKDMYLMSRCKHNIIANSSFSWWGAWLNNNSNKIVVAPKNWFGNSTEDCYKDIVPKSWERV